MSGKTRTDGIKDPVAKAIGFFSVTIINAIDELGCMGTSDLDRIE
jgi:hypothetical protein